MAKEWGFAVSNKRRSGFNIIVTITYSKAGETDITENFANPKLNDLMIGNHARQMIDLLKDGDVAIEAVTIGPGVIPDAPVQDEKRRALAEATAELEKAARREQLKTIPDPDGKIQAALEKLDNVEAAAIE